jgi:hypothetical protein
MAGICRSARFPPIQVQPGRRAKNNPQPETPWTPHVLSCQRCRQSHAGPPGPAWPTRWTPSSAACCSWTRCANAATATPRTCDAGEPPLLKFDHELVLDGREPAPPLQLRAAARAAAPDVPTHPAARPLVVVDPRAGHGPGIGGFKQDSEVGVALRAGHPVYFVTFRPQPEEGQTLADVMNAEARFLEEVIARHPKASAKPVVIGNCQAGWAISMLAAVRPELFGPLMVVGAPLSTGPAAPSSTPCATAAPRWAAPGWPHDVRPQPVAALTARTWSRTSRSSTRPTRCGAATTSCGRRWTPRPSAFWSSSAGGAATSA